jgi:hypothetical protein
VAIDHYSKWVEAKAIVNRRTKIITIFFEDDTICGFGIPKHVLMDNGRKWAPKFDQLCKNYKIDHQYTS